MAFTYRQVKDLHDVLAGAGVTKTSLPEWATEMNALSGTDLYGAGLHDNLIKRASVGIDRALEWTGLPDVTERFGRSVGEAVGNAEAGASIGRSLPRTTLNFLPMLIPGLGVGATAARLGGMAALAGAGTYTDTGSPAAGVLSGVTAAALPGITNKIEQLVLGRVGGRLVQGPIADATGNVSQFSRYFPTTVGQGLTSQAAGQGAAAAATEVSAFGTDVLTGQPLHNPFSTETLLNLTLGQLPFAGLYATKGGKASLGGRASHVAAENAQREVTRTEARLQAEASQNENAGKSGIESIANFVGEVDQKVVADNNNRIQQLRQTMRQKRKDGTTVDMDEWNRLTREENDLIEQQGERPNRVAGVALAGETPRRIVAGREVTRNKAGTWRMIELADDPGNGDLAGKLVGYSTLHEPSSTPSDAPGFTNFSLPEGFFTELPRNPKYEQRTVEKAAKAVAGQPDLPAQQESNEHFFDHILGLKEAEVALEAAKDPLDLQDALVKFNNIRESFGLPGVTDGQLRRRMLVTKQTDARKAAVEMVRKTHFQIERLREIESGENRRAEVEAAAVGDEALTDEVSRLRELENSISIKPGKNADKLVAGGELNRMYAQWVDGGRKDSWEKFAGRVLDSARTGKGLSDVALKTPADEVQTVEPTAAQPIKDIFAEYASKVVMSDPLAQRAFDGWEGKGTTDFQTEQARFALLYDELGQSLFTKPVKADDAADVNEILRQSGLEFDDTADVVTFKDRPHVRAWEQATQRAVLEGSRNGPRPGPQVPAGGGFVWGMQPYDPVTNRLGKHTVPKTGVVPVSLFKNIGGRDGRPLPDVEIEIARLVVPEAFEGGNVNVKKLTQGLKEKGPVLEVKALGEGGLKGVRGQIAGDTPEAAIHGLETEGYNVYEENGYWIVEDEDGNPLAGDVPEDASPQVRAWLDQLADYHAAAEEYAPPGASRYSFLGPKPEAEMPGYVEGLVRLPLGGKKDVVEGAPQLGQRRENQQYRGPHFGSEDTNVLAFFRGYEETLPDGRKAFHVIEVQSDWGQHKRTSDERRNANLKNVSKGVEQGDDGLWYVTTERGDNRTLGYETEAAAKQAREKLLAQMEPEMQGSPLLRVYETLALKAAINHARAVGADTLVLSDAETAMMTEGHDRNANFGTIGAAFFDKAQAQRIADGLAKEKGVPHEVFESAPGEWSVKSLGVPQEAGMRLHYDTTLPSALAKLTGERGVPVELGVHKMADSFAADRPPQVAGILSGSPVFRDAAGQPKTAITGRAFPLARAFQNIDTQGGLTFSEASRSAVTPFLPQTPADTAVVTAVGETGQSLYNFLSNSSDPFVAALMKDLQGRAAGMLARTRVLFTTQEGSTARMGSFQNALVTLGEGSLRMPAEFRDREYAHELLHAITLNGLADPINKTQVAELDALRKSLIERLPQGMKERLVLAKRTNFLDRYNKNPQTSWRELGNQTEAEILYGLLNNKEFISQGFSSDAMRNFMRQHKGEGKNAFKKFVNWVKTMVGFGENVKDTAFEEFMGHVDGLLTQGEYSANLSNFSERYLMQRGLSGQYAKAQAQRAVGIAKLSTYGTSATELFDLLSLPSAFKSPELADATKRMLKSFGENDANAQETASVLRELELPTDRNGVDEMLTGMLHGEVKPEALDVLPASTSKYLWARLEDMRTVLDALDAAGRTKGLLNLAAKEALTPSVTTAMRAVDKALASKAMHDRSVEAIQSLMTRTAPDGWMDFALTDEPSAALRTFLGDAAEEGQKGTNWLSRFLKPPSQMARDNPESAEGISRGYELPANARKMASEGLKVFGIDVDAPGGKITHEGVQRMSKALGNSRVEKAVNKWMYENQKQGKDTGVQILPDSTPEVHIALKGLTPAERADVLDIVTKQQVSQQMMQAQIVEKMGQIADVNAATLLGRFTGLKVGQNITVANAVRQALTVDFTNPVEAQQAQQKLAEVQTKVSPEAFQSIFRYLQLENAKIGAWREHFAANPAWASGQRYGKYIVTFKRGKRTFTLGADSKAEARKLAEGGIIENIEPNRKADDDAPLVLGPEADKMILRLRELEENQVEMLRANGVPEEELAALRRTSPVAQFERETAATVGIPNVIPPARGLTRGADELPWLSNHFSWVQKASTYWSRQLFRAQTRAHLLEPEIAKNPALQSWMRTHFENILHQDPEGTQKFKRFMTTWFMGYNPANVIVNSIQPFVTHVAEFTALTGKPIDSYNRVLRALREVGGNVRGRKDWATEEHAMLMNDAVDALEVGYGKFDDEQAAQESIATNYKRILAGNKPQTLGQRLGRLAGVYSTAGMWMFQQGEQVNNRAALLAAFDFYKEKGLSYEDAKQKAFEFNRAVNFGGGRANRPVGAFSGGGAFPRSAAMLGTALQSYVLGTTFQLVRYLKGGLFRPGTLTPAERHAALKAGVQLLATQFAAAGLLGLPFVSGAIALLDKAFPELELNRKLRENVKEFLSSDEENGSILSDIAMTGVPSMFGWDLQSRLSMGNTLPGVSEINGFQPENLMGPAAGLVTNFVNGFRKVAGGDSNGALSFVPPFLRKGVELMKEDWGIQDYRGRPLFEPTAGEKLGIALGFNPKRLNDFNAAQRVAEQNRLVETRRAGQFHQSLAEEITRGNFGTVRAKLLERAQSDKTYDPVEGVRSVARAAEEITFPRDLRREGTVGTSSARSRLLSTFRLDPSDVSEVARLQFRQQTQQRLGLPVTTGRETLIAQLMDQGRQLQPTATRAELRRQAELMLRRGQPQTLALQPVGQ